MCVYLNGENQSDPLQKQYLIFKLNASFHVLLIIVFVCCSAILWKELRFTRNKGVIINGEEFKLVRRIAYSI